MGLRPAPPPARPADASCWRSMAMALPQTSIEHRTRSSESPESPSRDPSNDAMSKLQLRGSERKVRRVHQGRTLRVRPQHLVCRSRSENFDLAQHASALGRRGPNTNSWEVTERKQKTKQMKPSREKTQFASALKRLTDANLPCVARRLEA